MSFADVPSAVLRRLSDGLRHLKQWKIEGRKALNSGLRVAMEAAMMPTFISRLWDE